LDRKVVLSTAYLPPIQYFAKLLAYDVVYIESAENYAKQSYRNRCTILSANGPLNLSVPAVKSLGNHTPITKVGIDNSSEWQKNHWRAVESAYRSSPFFDFGADLLFPFYTQRFENLFELNMELLKVLLGFIGVVVDVRFTTTYFTSYPEEYHDCRYFIHPKRSFKADDHMVWVEYYQVFSDRFGFVPNLSVIDLIFNEGLGATSILKSMNK